MNKPSIEQAPSSGKPVNALKGSASAPAPKAATSSMWKNMKGYMPSKGTAIDVAMFSAAVYVIVFHGKDIADAFEGICPNEEQII